MRSDTLPTEFSQLTRDWFTGHYPAATDIQQKAWPRIAAGSHVLLTAPTGSGKTLTAFLWSLDCLLNGRWSANGLSVLYVSPLKALNNDIRENLLGPLEELSELGRSRKLSLPSVTVATRSGDTSTSERQRLWKKPPQILVTTPESLFVLLLSPKAPMLFGDLKCVIVDEVHALFNNRRGVQLTSCLEWLRLYCNEFQRIALSATVKPLTDVASFIGGYRDGVARPVEIIESASAKEYVLDIAMAKDEETTRNDNSYWEAAARHVAAAVESHQSTLVFCNGRSDCERLTQWVNQGHETPLVFSHHGSLAREVRHDVEKRMKAGSLRGIIATSSLELGIDVGAIDYVILLNGAPSVAAAAQRIGRSGHRAGAVSRSCLLAGSPLEILEAMALREAVLEHDVEPAKGVRNCLDYLTQLLAALVVPHSWSRDELLHFVRDIWCYHDLTERQFDEVLNMAAGVDGYSIGGSRNQRVNLDRETNIVSARENSRRLLYFSGGTIPDTGMYKLRHIKDKSLLGELDEVFVWELRLGEAITLGTNCWRVEKITHDDVLVSPERGHYGIPFWQAPPNDRSYELSERIGKLLEQCDTILKKKNVNELLKVLTRRHGLSADCADAFAEVLKYQTDYSLLPLPHRHQVVLERVEAFLESDEQLFCSVLHTFWGGRVNRPFALALAEAWQETYGKTLTCHCSDDAIWFFGDHLLKKDAILEFVTPETFPRLLRASLEHSSYFAARFRECAGRALLLPKGQPQHRKPLWMQRADAAKLWEQATDLEHFPIVEEAWRSCLQDDFDIPALQRLLAEIRDGSTVVRVISREEPTPFAKQGQWSYQNELMYKEDGNSIPAMHDDNWLRRLLGTSSLNVLIPDECSAEYVAKRQRLAEGYAPETAEQLVGLVSDRWLIPCDEWEALEQAICRDSETRKAPSWLAEAWQQLCWIDHENHHVGVAVRWRQDELDKLFTEESVALLTRWLPVWLTFEGVMTRTVMAQKLSVPKSVIDDVVEQLGNQSLVPTFMGDGTPGLAERETLEILVRMARNRRSLMTWQPVDLIQFQQFVAKRQGFATQNESQEAAERILALWAGMAMPADLLEKLWLPSRFAHYDPAWLDSMCQSTLLCTGWGKGRLLLLRPEDVAVLPPPQERQMRHDVLNWNDFWHGEASCNSFAMIRQALLNGDSSPQQKSGNGFGYRASQETLSHRLRSKVSTYTPQIASFRSVDWAPPPEDALAELELQKERVRIVLDRYGVLFKALLEREEPAFRWGTLFPAMRIMEMAGEIVSGHFVDGVNTLQFTTLDELERLQQSAIDGVWWLSAVDACSLCSLSGVEMPTGFPHRLPGNFMVFEGSRLVATIQRRGEIIDVHDPEATPRIEWFAPLKLLLERRCAPLPRIKLSTFAGQTAVKALTRDFLKEWFAVEKDIILSNWILYRKY